MTTKEKILDIFREWGIPVKDRDEYSVVIRYEMKYFQVSVSEGSEADAVTITYAGIFTADNEREMNLGLRACNDLNASMVHVKLYIDHEADLVLASEFFHSPDDNLEAQIVLGLQAINAAKKRFIKKYEELDKKTALNPAFAKNNLN